MRACRGRKKSLIFAYHVPEIAIGGEGWNGCVSSCFDVFRGSLRSGQGCEGALGGRTEQTGR